MPSLFFFDKKPSLSLADQKALGEQSVTEDSPGAILRDFEALLAFIIEKRPRVSGINNLLPMNALPELNARLSRPLAVKLKRPQQKSYANINGLYLLLRATGLAQVEREGSKQVLVADEAALESWHTLNPTERYFTLLEAWLIRGAPEMIGEQRGYYNPVGDCLRLLKKIPPEGLKIAGNRNEEHMIPFHPGLYSIALMEMFGLITIDHGDPEEGKGWKIISLHKMPFGEAILKLAMTVILTDEFWDEFENEQTPFGQLQRAASAYFPEWHNNLALPETKFRDGTFIFKVSLGKVWRRIAIRGKSYLEDLSDAILAAFKFDHDHLYRFTYKNRFGVESHVNHYFLEERPFTTEVRIGDLPLQPGSRMIYLYDFGDNWEFDLELERIDEADPKLNKPRIIESRGKAPKQYQDWDEDEW